MKTAKEYKIGLLSKKLDAWTVMSREVGEKSWQTITSGTDKEIAQKRLNRILEREKESEEQIRIRLWVKEILEEFPEMEKPANLKTLDDCVKWFKDYKKVIKEKGSEWSHCKDALDKLGVWESNLTKNQAYLRENSTIINALFKHYVL